MEGEINHIIGIACLIAGFAAHILSKVVKARETDKKVQLKDYLGAYPYKTALALLMGFGGYVMALQMGELTYFAAVTAGYMANDIGGHAPNKKIS